ncbi:uncharacterized protein LOC124634134 [Helicoverpa zea]|uniref:uncharacterized protein LOC124634134 n=1 Tax=Helicoverpa zea TaxID=7113 RepID=UPI001F5614D4|nr:uncharacterized protein LOC124634134 [Helicoverpa zea]
MRSKTSNFNIQLQCYVLPSITTSLPASHIYYDTLLIPDNVCLADPTFNIPSEIDLLIGADVYGDLLEADRIRLSNGPYLQNSKSNVDTHLRKFWELEEVVNSGSVLTEEERQCEEYFIKTTTRDNSGRFSVRVPLKESADVLGDSYERAKSRFLSLERKLDKSPSYKRLYSDFLREYNDLGHMSKINEYAWPHYFLLHHGVFREHSSTTKLRVVFDASAATTSNKSLNDIQMIGPPLLNDIPRLELCGALLGARLYRKILSSLRLTFTKVYFWTDSTIVMGWIRMPPHNLKTFVQNRVSQINDLTGDAIWLHIKGTDNPADIVSRGLHLNELQDNDLWWHGPAFLQSHDIEWSNNVVIDNEKLPELKVQHASMVCSNQNSDCLVDFNRFSSFNRLRRMSAYVLRFIGNTRVSKQDRKTGSLSVIELDAATIMLARLAQLQSFNSEYSDLDKKSVVKSKRILGLNPFLDEFKLIRVGGRLSNCNSFNNNKKHPILLCDPNDLQPLTPAHFLIGRPLTAPACRDLTEISIHRLMRYDVIEQMRQIFWKRWAKEYVAELQTRTKWKTRQDSLAINQLALIKDDNLPPLKWKLGRIIRMYPGTDGISRVADLLTSSGITRRAFSKICPLPVSP